MEQEQKPKWVTLDSIKRTMLAGLFNPMPKDETIRSWLEKADVPRMKTNEDAKRGGGPLYYHAQSVEKVFAKFGGGQ